VYGLFRKSDVGDLRKSEADKNMTRFSMPVNVPNFITICRILLVPVTIWLIISNAFGFAFAAFALAGISDAVDGLIARRFSLQTELGAYLDAIADKALLVSIFVSLGILAELPPWLVILVVTRDILIVSAVVLSWLLGRPMAMQPSMTSKINTTGQIMLAVFVLAALAFELQLGSALTVGEIGVAAFTFASGALYMRDWVKHMSTGAQANTQEGNGSKVE
jgi:cardiolipin synthase (CMP-forming)